jgi:hypothetical protein
VGFEPTREQNPLPVFKTGALNHSATLPCVEIISELLFSFGLNREVVTNLVTNAVGCIEPCRRITLHRLADVGINVEGDRDACVP